MSDELHGHVSSIATAYHGGSLVADAATGATVLFVNDVAQFAIEGGSLRIAQADGTFLAAATYVEIDDDAASITLSAPTTADAFAGAAVRVLDANGSYVADAEAAVVDDDNGSVATIDVHHSLIRLLTGSVRAGIDESVVATRDKSGAWEVTRVLGKIPVLDAPHGERGRATDAAITASTNTVLSYDTFPVARGGMQVAAGVWTVPTDGRYLITANVQWEPNATGQRRTWFLLNGTATGAEERVDATTTGNTCQSVSQAIYLMDGDEITVMVSQSNSSSATLHVLSGSTVTITGLD